jgi:hypothetical protein
MNGLIKNLSILTIALSTTAAFASPTYLTTHNNTNVESNAYIAGFIPSPSPTKAKSTNSLLWVAVRMACVGHTSNNKCPALIKMATDSATPVELGTVELDIETGEITPKIISANGYTLTVDGPGEATLTQNDNVKP